MRPGGPAIPEDVSVPLGKELPLAVGPAGPARGIKKCHFWASLVAQWLGIHLPMQGTRVRALVREDPTCHGATKPAPHNY